MATYQSAVAWINSNYVSQPVENGLIRIEFNIDEGARSQVVLVDWAGQSEDTATWINFMSAVGPLNEVPLPALLNATNEFVAGGIVAINDTLFLRVSIPLENLDANEISEPIRLVCLAADQLEQRFTARDVF